MNDPSPDSINLKSSPTPRATTAPLMPQAPEVEKSILSMMIIDPTNIISQCISNGMNEQYFYIPAHRILWSIFRERFDKAVPIDITSVAQQLADSQRLEAVGGAAGLTDVFSFATSTALFDSHYSTLEEKYIRRSIILTANRSTEQAFHGESEVEQLLDETEQAVLQIRRNMDKGEDWSLKKDIQSAMTNLERMLSRDGNSILGITSSFPELDKKINGLKSGELFVIAARPAMGKTSFLLNIMEHIALDCQKPVLIFSCEMPSVQLVERLLFARSHVDKRKLLEPNEHGKRELSTQEIKNFSLAMKELGSSKLVIDDTPAISISELRAKARRVIQDHPDLSVIGIDYLQLMRSHTKQAQNSREREIAEISGGLKSLAKELGLPIVVLAQLNRGPESRTGKNKGTPMMSDLRESGAIEQDADMIGLLYRSGYYAETEEEKEALGDEARLVLAKNRNGPTGTVYLNFEAHLMKFTPGEPRMGDDDE